MAANPATVTGATLRPSGGWLRSASINGIVTYCDSGSMSHSNNFQFTRYALTFPSGERQKVLHSRGTKEVSWTVSGDLSVESMAILNFLNPYYRGLIFPVAILNSSYDSSEYLAEAMMESFSLDGSADGTIKFTISGKSLTDISAGPSWAVLAHKYPVPAWASGNTLLRSWSITHGTQLQANWHNGQRTLPTYYRPAESEYTMQIQSMTDFTQYDTISIGVGTFSFVNGIVTSRSVNHSGREPRTYDCQVTNVNPFNEPQSPGGVVNIAGTAPVDWI